MEQEKLKRIELAINDLHLGKRIQDELKEQGRAVSWLANQLGMKRTSLYYIFHQNSLDLELLMRISFILDHNFMRDVVDLYDASQLLPQ